MMHRGKSLVSRRRVFYIPGFDPNPARRYRELYRTESKKQAEISGYRIGQKPDKNGSGWQVRAEIDGKKVHTKVDVLVWSDLVQTSMKAGILGTYAALFKTSWIYLSTGTLRRLSWLAKGPVVAALYPVIMLLLQLLIAVVGATFAARLITAICTFGAGFLTDLLGFAGATETLGWAVVSAAIFWGVFFPALVLGLRWFKSIDHRTYAHYLMQDYAYTAKKRGAYPPEIDARLVEFRHRIESALRDNVDEVLVIGHSSGAHLAVSVIADIVRANRNQKIGPDLSLLTLGQVIPMVSFLPSASRLRMDLNLLSTADEITWLDVSAPGDGCSFALTDPVSVSGVAPRSGQKWPIVISAAFSNTLSEETRKKLRYRYFRLHFQYLCAFDWPGDYDYFKVTAGPLTLGQRFQGRRSSVSRIDVAASRFTSTVSASTFR